MKKGQKLVKALAIFTMSAAAVSCAVAVGCKKHTHTFSDEWKSDDSGHWYSATCGHDEKKDYAPHVYDNDADDDCNECGYVRHDFESKWLFDYNNHYHACKYDGCDEHGSVGAHKFGTDNKCTDCGAKFATYEFIPDKLEATTYAEGHVNGIFTVLPGTTVRLRSRLNYSVYDWNNGEGDSTSAPVVTDFNATKSVQYNGTDRGISVKAIAPGKLTIYVDNGSGGKTKKDRQTILLTKPDGNTQVISYYCGDIYAITIDCETAGVYKISRGNQPGVGTTDLYYAKFETVVEETPVENIQIVNKGKDRYVKGETFDSSKLQLEIVRETTGITEPLDLNAEGLVIDSSAFNANVAGTYTIKVSYTVDGKTFKDEYTVVVYDVEAIELGFNKIIQSGNTSAGNGQYVNVTVKQFYFKDEALNLNGLTVKTVLDEGKQKVIVTEGYEVTGFVAGQAGKQTVKVAWTDNPEIFATFDVYVANYTAASIATNKDITVNVNVALADEKVGVLENGAYQFKTIQQSLDFLNALNLEQNVKKTINLSEGLYKERIEINIPNLTIKGADNAHPEKTVIEWDSLVGIADESGFVHITDSTATLNVREKAVGFVIEGVTISNWYNSTEHFDEAFGPGYAEHRALAALIQADKVVIDNCRLLGYQDTIELFTGRQLIQNTYICGRTDFIFGTNNTTYFKDCTIESIVDGGYVTAFKGNNKGDNDWVQYGAIFDGCNFIAPEAVIAKKDTSLGRTWGKYAAVAYVNCDFAGHISTTPYSSAKGTRYTAMSSAEPTDPTVKFVEYNNTGDGAVNKSIAGMTYLTAEQAANYSDYTKIFGTINGKVTYSATWIPVTPGTETHNVTVVIKGGEALGSFAVADGKAVLLEQIKALFTENEKYKDYGIVGVYSNEECTTEYTYPAVSADGTVYIEIQKTKVSVDLKDATFTNGSCIEDINSKYADTLVWSGSAIFETAKPGNGVKIGTDTVITVNIVGEVSLVAGYELPENDYIITYKNGKATIKFVAATGAYGTYLGGISIDLTKTPEDSQTVNVTVDYNDGTTANGTLEAVVGLPLGKPADPVRDGYKFLGWQVNGVDYTFTENVTEAFTLVAQWESQNDYDLTTGGTVNLYEFTTGQLQGSESTYRGIIVDATASGAKFAPRPNVNDVQVNAGVKIKFKVNAGTTKEQISVSFTATAGDQYLPTAEISIETIGDQTYAVVTLGSGYPSTMTVTIS